MNTFIPENDELLEQESAFTDAISIVPYHCGYHCLHGEKNPQGQAKWLQNVSVIGGLPDKTQSSSPPERKSDQKGQR